jgi:hypothetical protein
MDTTKLEAGSHPASQQKISPDIFSFACSEPSSTTHKLMIPFSDTQLRIPSWFSYTLSLLRSTQTIHPPCASLAHLFPSDG